jgi:hypothetical protein
MIGNTRVIKGLDRLCRSMKEKKLDATCLKYKENQVCTARR